MADKQAGYDVAVIGAGISGLCIGALLAKAGKKVLVLEKQKDVGGRAVSVFHKGHVIDNGIHMPSRSGFLEAVYEKIDKPYPELTPCYKATEVYHQGRWQNLMDLTPHKELRKIFNEITMNSYEDLEKYDDVSLKDWVSQRSGSEGLHLWFYFMGMAFDVGNEYEPLSTGELLYYLKAFLDTGKSLGEQSGVVIGGMNNLMKPLVESITENGGEVRTGVTVSRVIIENRVTQGIEIETGERLLYSQILDTEVIEVPVVVSTLPAWHMWKVLDRKDLPIWYVDMVDRVNTKFSSVWTIFGRTKEPLWDEYTLRWVPNLPHCDKIGYFFTLPTYGSAVNEYHYEFFIQGNYNEMPDLFNLSDAEQMRGVRRILADFEKDLVELFPDLEKTPDWKLLAQAEPYSIAQSAGLVGKARPSAGQVPGVENLYLSSVELRQGRGMGLQAAAQCALFCVDQILGK